MYAWIAEVRARRRALLLAASLGKYPRPEVLAKFSPLEREVLDEALSILPPARMAVYRDRRLKMQPFIEKNKNYKKFVASYFKHSELFERHGFKSPSPFPMPSSTRLGLCLSIQQCFKFVLWEEPFVRSGKFGTSALTASVSHSNHTLAKACPLMEKSAQKACLRGCFSSTPSSTTSGQSKRPRSLLQSRDRQK
ncbi:hypothetical protein BDZ88DRAFT_123149 [Geranomyces variabilis]|nr:hypothetical protein BDZ88DRAFT_123149 [Geranomyces variabilis]